MKKAKQIGIILAIAVLFYMMLPFTVNVVENSVQTETADYTADSENGIMTSLQKDTTPSPKPVPMPEGTSNITVVGTFCSAEKADIATPVPTEAPQAPVVSTYIASANASLYSAIPIQVPFQNQETNSPVVKSLRIASR